MKILELFSGTESFSKVARERGHETFTVDIEPKFKPNLVKDIMDLKARDIPFKPDIIWASPPCQTFSVASVYRYWTEGRPKNDKCLHGIAMVKRTIELIKQINPKFFIIENPRGMLRKQDFMQELHRDTVTYCQYGAKTQKPTDLWNNLNHVFRPMCKAGSPCHEKASRSSKNGVQGITNSFNDMGGYNIMRAVIPKDLCEEILKACEGEIK